MRALFSFHGRCGRLAYLGIFVVQMAFLLLAAGVGVAGIAMGAAGSGIGGLLGVLVIIGGVVGMVWIGAAALARRARDIGWQPVVVVPLWYVMSFLAMVPIIGIPISLAQVVIGLILIFKGPVPYEDDRARGHSLGHSLGDLGEDTRMDDAIAAMVAARNAQKAASVDAVVDAAPARRSAVTRVAKAPQAGIGLSPAKRGGFGQRGLTA